VRDGGIFHERFGLNFKHYHDQFPTKTIEILECGNSNGDNNLPITDDAIARNTSGGSTSSSSILTSIRPPSSSSLPREVDGPSSHGGPRLPSRDR